MILQRKKNPNEETIADEFPLDDIILSDIFDVEELDDSTVIVSSYEELASALNKDNGYEYIYLANDITQGSTDAGISIHASKERVVIDGLAPGADEPATFTQRSSSTFVHTIYVDNQVTTELRLCNINLVGRNYYGIISISDAVYDFDLIYENISYTGPQITYNNHGSAHYSNSTIKIARDASGGSPAQEVAEVAEVIFSDIVTIDSESTTEVNLYEDATLTYTGQRYGLLLDAQRLQSLHLHEGAGLFVTQTANNYVYGTLYIRANLQLDEGSSLIIDRKPGGPAIQFSNNGATAVFIEPERVKLYAPSKKLISFNYDGTLKISTDAVNIWLESEGFTNDSIDNTPKHRWNRLDSQLLEISASSKSGKYQTVSSNLDSSDFAEPLNIDTFDLGKSQMLVFGCFQLAVDPIYENSTEIGGYTEQDATIIDDQLIDCGVIGSHATLYSNGRFLFRERPLGHSLLYPDSK